jgi:tetratricopeptide (TPR) repeat protein
MNYRYGGKDVELLKYLEERVEKNPASSFFAMLSYFYLDAGKIAEALSIAQRGVIAHPNYSTGHVVLAMAMMKARLYYDARKELAKASDLRPGSRIVESLAATLDKEEQADEIGRKLAEQFHKNRASGKDLIKTIEDTIESYRAKAGSEDFIIPGLDAIVGGEPVRIGTRLKTPTMLSSKAESSSKYSNLDRDRQRISEAVEKGEKASTIAKAIIEKVSHEMESDKPSVQDKSVSSPDLKEPTDVTLSRPPQATGLSGESSPEEISTKRFSGHPETIGEPPSSSITGESAPPIYGPDEMGSETGDFDLDALARELEAAGPIKPPEDHLRESSGETGIDLNPEIVTETLAKIFEQQGQFKTAIEAYTILLQKKPEQAETYRKKIAELTQRTNG